MADTACSDYGNVQHLIADVHFAVIVWISALILFPGRSRVPHSNGARRASNRWPTTITRPQEPGFTCRNSCQKPSRGANLLRGTQPRRTRSQSACGLEASFEYRPRSMVVQALVNRTRRPNIPVLCRAVSQIVGYISSVAIQEVIRRHLKAAVGRRCVGRACLLCRMRGSLPCSELPSRTHLHHRRRELPRSMCCRIRKASPGMRRKVRSRATSPTLAIRRSAPTGSCSRKACKNSSWEYCQTALRHLNPEMVLVWLLVSPHDP